MGNADIGNDSASRLRRWVIEAILTSNPQVSSIADLRVVANLLGDRCFFFGTEPATIDAAIYAASPTPITTTLRRR
ncbi:glutathione S-transferase C-terminal domain-containing protein [Caballeronia sp. LZ062]|uniref:glutathione S-transferase C-terminal domain-containing protein n=1 Tax=unclassified Caballeronia TaxID=2646786 RepID=UPI00285676C3|nr:MULTISPECIES: glutathione S-transferase C-terminal domain-containing protein [unclassified Caballeronia]MDR5856192.1 glutathione S-transferase C-terminal domain-containing protein [Caballeronia sp. LZ050]MDR5872863.1 glutathione S-transferase C-terminal domain-containing protein [Caballeronia sp. LZ062]